MRYIEKSSGLAFVVDEAVEKLHEFGDKNINSTIDFIITRIDEFVDPNIPHYHHAIHGQVDELLIAGKSSDMCITS